MSQKIDLKELWKRKETEVPDLSSFLQKINNYKTQKMKALVITNLILASTAAFIILVFFYYQPQFLSTKIGIIVIIFAIVIYLFVYNRFIPLLLHVDELQSNSEYLTNLLKIKARQKFLLHVVAKLYFILFAAGLCLYMYEYVLRMNLFWSIVTYGIAALWILINLFYFVPRSVKKQEEKLDNLISKIRILNRQLKSEEK